MTNPDKIRQQKARRLQELSRIARQRYLDAGGDPYHSANQEWMTEAEQQEFLELGNQVFDEEYINKSLEKKRQSNHIKNYAHPKETL